jgi:hypothetical protein
MSADAPVAKGVVSAAILGLVKTELSSLVTTPEGLAITALMISILIFNLREPDHKANRYNLEDLKANPTFQNIFKFVYYFYLDGLIGHKRITSSAKVGDDGKTIVVKPGVPARGLLGAISDITKPVADTLAFAALSGAFLKTGGEGLLEWIAAQKVLRLVD